jgi:hypothetical protein
LLAQGSLYTFLVLKQEANLIFLDQFFIPSDVLLISAVIYHGSPAAYVYESRFFGGKRGWRGRGWLKAVF